MFKKKKKIFATNQMNHPHECPRRGRLDIIGSLYVQNRPETRMDMNKLINECDY